MRCANCGAPNREVARICRHCGKAMIRVLPPSNASLSLREGEALAKSTDSSAIEPSDLRQMYVEFYRAAEVMHGGSPWWELIGKHLEAYRIHSQIDGFRRGLEDRELAARYRAVDQRNLALDRERQVLYDDSHRRLDLSSKLKHLEDAMAELDNLNLPDSMSPDLKEEIAGIVIGKVIESIFGNSSNTNLGKDGRVVDM